MIMFVLNKSKLKKIVMIVIALIVVLAGIIFTINKTNTTPTFNLMETTEMPYYQGTKPNSGYVALICNVDLGWESEYVESILETLKKENVKITFNVTGKWAEKNQELLLKIKDEGHEIGNHGHKHLDYANLSYEDNLEQIKTSKTIIENIIKQPTKFFQAPAGSFGDNTIKAAKELDYICFKWDLDTIDWKYREQPNIIIDRISKKEMKDGSIILMHPTNATTECIDDIIKIVRDKGFKPGKLSDIFIVE